MPKPITREMLERMTVKERMVIYEHARNTASPQADDIIEQLFQYQLLDSAGGGLPRHHPVIHAIEATCRSAEGRRAAISAAENGEAPMAGVDPLLRSDVREYGHFDTTSWAGTFVADEIEAAGWVRQGRKALPGGSVARTAAFFCKPELAQ